MAVGHVKDALVDHPARDVIDIPVFAIVDIVAVRVLDVLQGPLRQGNLLIPLSHQNVSQLVGFHEDATGTNGIAEKRVGTIEAVDVARAVGDTGPPSSLHRTRGLNG